MENSRIYPGSKEYTPHAHKLETPQPLISVLRSSAEKIGQSEPEELIDNLVNFRLDISAFMDHFNITMLDFESDMQDKRFSRGGFRKRAVQKHPFLGIDGLRLVRDELSNGTFLKKDRSDLYHKLLERKIVEETIELTECMSRKERKEELGDVFEVFNTFLDEMGISRHLVEDKVKSEKIKIAKRRRLSKQKK